MTTTAGTIFPEDDRPALAGWIAAALFVVAAHLILAFVILHMREDADSGAEAPPAVMIDLASLAVAPPATEQLDVPEAPEKTEKAEPDEVKPTPPDIVPPVEQPQQMVQPLEPPPDNTPPPPVEQPPLAVAVPESPLAPKPEAILPPLPKPAPPPKPAPKVEKKVEKPVVKHDHKPPAERTAAPKHIDAEASRNAAAPQSQGAPSQSNASWGGLVRARIMAVKSCPAGGSGASGVATVSFSITGSGSLAGAHVSGSSGNSALDAEATSMVRRAGPYPPPPSGGTVSLSVPIRFGC